MPSQNLLAKFSCENCDIAHFQRQSLTDDLLGPVLDEISAQTSDTSQQKIYSFSVYY